MLKWDGQPHENETLLNGRWVNVGDAMDVSSTSPPTPPPGTVQSQQSSPPNPGASSQVGTQNVAAQNQALSPAVARAFTQVTPGIKSLQEKTLERWRGLNWTTYTMSNGAVILAYKALSRLGQNPYGYEYVVMTQESPYFQIKTGSDLGGEGKAYLDMQGTYKIETDPGAENVPVYTWRNRQEYDRLLWVATKPRKQTLAGRTPRAPDTKCCVLWKNGKVAIMSRAHFTKVTTQNEKKAIEAYCESVGIQTPWEMDPKSLVVPVDSSLGRQLLKTGRTGGTVPFSSEPYTVSQDSANHGALNDMSTLISSFESGQKNILALVAAQQTRQDELQQQLTRQQEQQTEMLQQLKKQQEQQAQLTQLITNLMGRLPPVTS